jgi:hypothetical protein
MEEHKRNGWYLLGGVPTTAGVGLAVGWYVAVLSSRAPGKLTFWTLPAYLAAGLITVGVLLVLSVMYEVGPAVAHRRTTQAPKVASTFRRPGHIPGIAVTELATRLPDGRKKPYSRGPIFPASTVGELPIAVDMRGPSGQLVGQDQDEMWLETADDVAIVNHSDDYISCRVWLTVNLVPDELGLRELERMPNDLVSLEPRETARVTLQFGLAHLALFEEVPVVTPKELLFREVGGKERELRIPFSGMRFQTPPATSPHQDTEQTDRESLRELLAQVLLEGDKRRLALLRACEPFSTTPSCDMPDDPAPAEGAALARWLADCEASVKDLLKAPAVVDMRMHRGNGVTPYYVGRDRADAYSAALNYIDWLRGQLVTLDGPSTLDFKGEL